MQTSADLQTLLQRIDHRGYPAYKDTKGQYQFPGFVLSIDHVQGDPFAAPSKVSVRVSGKTAAFPKALYALPCQKAALADELTRQAGRAAESFAFQAKGSGKSGLLSVSRCGQEVLPRTACTIDAATGDIVLRMEIGFPANGRTINARALEKILFTYVPACVKKALFYVNADKKRLQAIADLAEDQQAVRDALPALGLVAFVANGSVLPRASGVSQRPMKDAVRFTSPKELAVTLQLPHRGAVTGMGVPKGVTLIVGGGYHGKSTLLAALERGVYNHIAGDGRELVITDATAVKLRAEDGRSIQHTDISLFINDLPNGKDTAAFCSEDASGSTSQAANTVEAMEAGARTFLIDEDTSATNFMIRDELMQRVIHRDMEPITPFIERIRELYANFGISTVLVAGSSGAYFHVADTILQMDRYVPRDITAAAKAVAKDFPAVTGPEAPAKAPDFHRVPCPSPAREDRVKIKTMGREAFVINRETVDLRGVEQITDSEQVTALGYALAYAERHLMDGQRTLTEVVDALEAVMGGADQPGGGSRTAASGRGAGQQGGALAALAESPSSVPAMALPRRQELFACLNRCRSLQIR